MSELPAQVWLCLHCEDVFFRFAQPETCPNQWCGEPLVKYVPDDPVISDDETLEAQWEAGMQQARAQVFEDAKRQITSDEAVEALAKVFYARDDDHFIRVGWGAENDAMKRSYRDDARAALQAAADTVNPGPAA